MRRSGWASGLGLLAAAACLAPAGDAHATVQVLQYNVEHPTYGNIGTYTNIVTRNGATTDVQTQLHIAVKLIGISLFHQDATREERWHDHRLIAFQSDTDDNGNKIDVTGKADGADFVIHTPSGVITAPSDVHPSNPWAPFVLHTDRMMSTKTGKVWPVVVTDAGLVTIALDGRTMTARKYIVVSNKRDIVWLNGGLVVAFQTMEHGAPIKFVLQRPSATASVQQPLADN